MRGMGTRQTRDTDRGARWLTATGLTIVAAVTGLLALPRLEPAWKQLGVDVVTRTLYRGQGGVSPAELRAAYAALLAASEKDLRPELADELAEVVVAMQRLDDRSERRVRLLAAIAALERAVAVSPLAADAWFKLALLRAQALRPREAARALVANLTLDPQSRANLERKVWLASLVWPNVQLSDIELLYAPIRTLYVSMGRREAVVNLTFNTSGEALVIAALRGQTLNGGMDAEADYLNILKARRP